MKSVIRVTTHASVLALASVLSAPSLADTPVSSLFGTPAAAPAPAASAPEPVAAVQAPAASVAPPPASTTSIDGLFNKSPVVAGGGTIVNPSQNQKPKPVQKDVLLSKAIRGFVLTGDPQKLVKSGNVPAGVSNADRNLKVPGEVSSLLQSAVGKPLTLNGLQDITQAMVRTYRNSGIQVVSVVAPEQDITGGVIQLLVVMGRMGNLEVEGARYFAKSIYADNFTTQRGEILTTSKVLEDLRWLNRNGFRQVDMIYKPGKGYGETDVLLRSTEARPMTVYGGVENTGNSTYGEERAFVGASLGNLFNSDHQLSYQYTTNFDDSTLNSHYLEYRAPLAGRQEIRANVAAADFKAKLQGGELEQKGDNMSGGLTYYRQIPRFGSFASDLMISTQFKRSNGNLLFGTENALQEKAKYQQLSVGWFGEGQDVDSRTRANVQLVGAFGGDLTRDGVKTEVDHVYVKGGVSKRYDLRNDTRVLVTADGQIAKDTLPAMEQFYLGGRGSVRGFKQAQERADSGATVNVTYMMADMIQNSHIAGNELRPYVFVDGGVGSMKQKSADGSSNTKKMGSVGAGVSYNYARNVTLDLSYGHQVLEKGLTDDGDSGRLHGSLVVRY